MRTRNERSREAAAAQRFAESYLTEGMRAEPTELAVKLVDMANEVQRLNAVLDKVVEMYTSVEQPLRDYLTETGDL